MAPPDAVPETREPTPSAGRGVGILVFEDAEVLDFAGPFEVFSVTAELQGDGCFDVWLVAERLAPVRAVNGLRVLPDHSFESSPRPDLLIVAGGSGSRREMHNEPLLTWVRRTGAQAEITMSVCSGARILARAGFLDGREATTHHEVLEELQELAPEAEVSQARYIDSGKIVTTGGISAGIDGSLHVVERLLGPDVARRTAEYMEYDWPG